MEVTFPDDSYNWLHPENGNRRRIKNEILLKEENMKINWLLRAGKLGFF
jgi:hypothetical protein